MHIFGQIPSKVRYILGLQEVEQGKTKETLA